jgi:hypothetical protein
MLLNYANEFSFSLKEYRRNPNSLDELKTKSALTKILDCGSK